MDDRTFLVQLTVGDLRQIIREESMVARTEVGAAKVGTMPWNMTPDGTIWTPFGPIKSGGAELGKEVMPVPPQVTESPEYITAGTVLNSADWDALMREYDFTKEQALYDINNGRLEEKYHRRK